MKVTNIFQNIEHTAQIQNPITLLSNKTGSYFSTSNNQTSYQGLITQRKNSMYKLIDSINFSLKPEQYINTEDKTILIAERTNITYRLENTLTLNIENYEKEISIDLDFRYLYKNPEFGRIYNIKKENNIIYITYKKYKTEKLEELQDIYVLAIQIKNLKEYSLKKLNKWIPKQYSTDKNRGYNPEKYINRTLSFKIKNGYGKIKISHGNNKQECKELLQSKNNYRHLELENFKNLQYINEITIAAHSLNKNIHTINLNNQPIKQIFAGWPWFFQFWTRDSLISLGALILLQKNTTVKKILTNYLTLETKKGLINSRMPKSQLSSIDSTGWLFKRYYDFLYVLQKNKKLIKYYTINELKELNNTLQKIFNDYITNNMKNGLIYSEKNQTWMDTDYQDKGRQGYCIEIQALTLSMIKTLKLLSIILNQKLNQHYLNLEKKILIKTRKKFYKNNKLADKITDKEQDFTQRPNIYIARYVYPHLFNNQEWEKIILNNLSETWLKWGGLTTISKTHNLYKEEHTGKNNESYHRGDSWYFINNIAITQLYKVNKNFFKNNILKITNASLKDMLFLGAIGCCSEISSAKQQTAQGCLNQSWSSATLIEALFTLSDKQTFIS